MNEPIICTELETSYDINLISGTLQHCCKFDLIQPNKEEIDLLGHTYLDLNKETVKARQELAQGIQTRRCKDCWSYENKNQPSWRIQQNKVLKRFDKNVHLNLQISSLCNQSCFYCVPQLSSSIAKFDIWADAISGYQSPVNVKKTNSLLTMEHIIEFVKNLPIDTKHFDLSLTGGEPFIVDKFNDNMKYIIDTFLLTHPNAAATINISSNTNVHVENLVNFYEMIRVLKEKYNSDSYHRLKMNITSSVENIEERAEYVRGGLVWSNFVNNFNIHNSNADAHEIRLTINPFTISDITNFFKYFSSYENLKFIYNYPFQKFFRIEILDDRFKSELLKLEDYVIEKSLHSRFNPDPWYQNLSNFMIDDKFNATKFKHAIEVIDKSRNTNWRSVFPEYIDWFDSIKSQVP